jgi:hypothetical protein
MTQAYGQNLLVKVRERIQELWSSDLNVKNRSVNRSPDWRWKKNKKMTEGMSSILKVRAFAPPERSTNGTKSSNSEVK